MKIFAFVSGFLFAGTSLFAQLPVVTLPTVPTPTQSVYISPTGNDANPGTQALPKKTFGSAMSAISFGTVAIPNNYGEIVMLPGDYYPGPNQGLVQLEAQWRQAASPWVYRNVSVRGMGTVRIHGDSMGNNQQMIYLMGSGISVKNISILGSKHHAVYFSGSSITRHHDVIVDSVTVDDAWGFGIYWQGYTRILAQHCVVNNTCKQNVNGISCLWPSGLRGDDCSHVTFRNNVVSRNWGEGINASYCKYVDVTDNICFDNYSVNLYAHSVSNAMYRNNLVYNSDSTYWRYCYGSLGTSASGISIANELSCDNGCFQSNNCGSNYSCCSYTDYDHPFLTAVNYTQLDSVYCYNNFLFETGIHIWDAFSGFGNYAYMNHIYVDHNTIIGREGTDTVTKAPIVITLNTAFIYFADIKLRNNILAMDTSLNNSTAFSGWAAAAVCNGAWTNNFTSTGNLWNVQPVVASVNFSGDQVSPTIINHAVPGDTANLTPSLAHPELVMADAQIPWITDDYFHNPRMSTTNAGAVEYNATADVQSQGVTFIPPSVYPNPANENVTLNLPANSQAWSYSIVNMNGELVATQSNLTNSVVISTAAWSQGVYIVHITNGLNSYQIKLIRW